MPWMRRRAFSLQSLLGPRHYCGPRLPPNQAMQLTASKLAVHALRVCHPRSGSVERHLGLAAADLVSR